MIISAHNVSVEFVKTLLLIKYEIIFTEYFLSGGSITFILAVEGANATTSLNNLS